ncbi:MULTISPECIES: hypothetical protein [unclassified Rhizobium]|uniref:hypothetical protein n=1 Tax=unclassified Rhizobium TaxID=2613769 RepID=UPI00247980CF|nr:MULTISPECIES: hypothetical protein [unclassified Rhizobium]MDH7801307.1 hypothetical protein [Rhizobium sp. AN70]
MSNLSSKDIKSVRKAHVCEQCNTTIEVGHPADYSFGIWEGYPYSVYVHPECRTAAHEYAELNDLWFEDYPWFQYMDDSEHGHHGWLLDKHPLVAKRLNIEPKLSGTSP